VFDQQWDARLGFAVEGDINGIKTRQIKFQLLEGHDEVAGAEMGIARQHHFRRQIDPRHDESAVGIHEIQANLVRALVLVAEGDAQGNGALRVRGRDLLGDDGIERAEQAQLPVFLGSGIAQNRNLNIHPQHIRHEFHQLARISLRPAVARALARIANNRICFGPKISV